MQMVYNSDSFVVVQFDVPADAADADAGEPRPRGGFEIVDKSARREIFIEGAVAASFKQGVENLVETGSEPEAFDDFIAGYTLLAQQPVTLH